MPRRLLRVGAMVRVFSERDPTLFFVMFSAWAALNGVSLLMTHEAFRLSPIYAVAHEFGLDDNWTGASMVLDALALLWSQGSRQTVRIPVALLSGLCWVFWGILLMGGGFRAGLWSSAGMFTLWSSFCMMAAAVGRGILDPLPGQQGGAR